MDAERWRRIQPIFHDALQLPDDRRAAFVRAACGGDRGLERDVLDLLAEDAVRDSPLDRRLEALADEVLGQDTPVPETIGPYRIERLLGEGGMGVVYLARRDDLDHEVAIKLLRDARLSPQRRERFLREQRLLARLSHPSICRLHDAGVLADGTPYFVMEFVDGLPLTTYCDRYGLPLDRRLGLLRDVARAVRHAHRQALIHRDLKPSNILAVRGRGEEGEAVRLLDFGIAKQTDPMDAEPATQTAFAMMTPAYAAPEQLRGEAVGVFTDVYALGVVLYELLTGSLPFDVAGLSPFEAAQAVIARDPERPSSRARRSPRAPAFVPSVGGSTWADLDVLCLTAMHRDPDRRYPTVDALLRDLDHFLAGEPLEARPDSVGYRLGKFVRRNRASVAAGLVAAAALAGLLTYSAGRLSAARDEALAEAARTERVQRFVLDLFEGGDDVVGPRRGLEVTTLLERGVREVRALDGEPAIQAELYQTLGGVYRRMAEFDRAETLLDDALAQRRAELGPAHPDVAETLSELGLVAADRGDLERAEDLERQALAIALGALADDHPRVARVRQALASVLIDRGDYAAAIDEARRASAVQERRGETGGLLQSLGYEANAHFYAGDYETSDRINRRLLDMTERYLGAGHPAYASALINLAATRRWLGYPEEAERLYRQALEINEAYHGRDHPTVASNLTLLGAVLADQERVDEARALLLEALAVDERVYGVDGYEVALVLNKLALLDLKAGDLDGAERRFRRELDIYRSVVGDEHASTATGWSNLATIAFRRGDLAGAETEMRRSLATYLAVLKPDHIDVGFARIKLGRLLLAAERYEDAAVELQTGLEILERQANPALGWIRTAREELARARAALGEGP